MTEEQKIKHDVELYGNGFGLMNADGSVTRLDPTMVFTFKSSDSKKTDLDRFKELYDIVGVPYKYKGNVLVINWLESLPNIEGYTEIVFDDNGKFIKQYFWE
jgi:hypothetical protein